MVYVIHDHWTKHNPFPYLCIHLYAFWYEHFPYCVYKQVWISQNMHHHVRDLVAEKNL